MSISLTDPAVWAGFLSLSVLEIVLGIDNVVFLAVIISRLPERQRALARKLGLGLAFALRIVLLLSLFIVIHLTEPIVQVMGEGYSWRDVILIAGGLFLLAKGTHEIHRGIGDDEEPEGEVAAAMFSGMASVIVQIAVIDLVFSVDSIVTAIGISEHIEVMIAAILVAILVMYFAAGTVGDFIEKYPTTKMLALSFLLLVGMALVADGLHFHIPRGYIYFSMAFAGAVELFNILAQRARRARRHSRGMK